MDKQLVNRREFSRLGVALAVSSTPIVAISATLSGAMARAGTPEVKFPDGTIVTALGQGSASLGQGRRPEADEAEALRSGISLGMTLIDTAEVYGDGRAEKLIGSVIAGQRDRVFLVSKVWPSHVTGDGIARACEASLARLGTDHLDLYLLHWPSRDTDLSSIVAAFESLRAAAKIRAWDVSNFEVNDMEDLFRVSHGDRCAKVGAGSLLDKLFVFAAFASSPDPDALAEAAVKAIQQHPLQALAAGIYDKDGKVVHRSEAANWQGDPGASAIRREISQQESLRRNVIATAIEIGRRNIMTKHFLPEDLLTGILRHSAFVPPELVLTYSRALLRFFQGDFSSALYTLTPLLEASLRHYLKLGGHDVTVFDDATQTQKDRTISQLFEQMRDELDNAFSKPITADLESVFLIRPGPHIRHDVAHGLLHDGAAYSPDALYACWLVYRLCLLPLFPYLDQLRGALAQGGLGVTEELD